MTQIYAFEIKKKQRTPGERWKEIYFLVPRGDKIDLYYSTGGNELQYLEKKPGIIVDFRFNQCGERGFAGLRLLQPEEVEEILEKIEEQKEKSLEDKS